MHRALNTISLCQPPADNADGVMAVAPSAGCVVDTLHAQRPARSWRHPLALQFTQPGGFWMRVHPACALGEVLHGIRLNRAQRAQA